MASRNSDSTLLTAETDDSLSTNGSSDEDGGNAAIAGGSGAGDHAVVGLSRSEKCVGHVTPLPTMQVVWRMLSSS